MDLLVKNNIIKLIILFNNNFQKFYYSDLIKNINEEREYNIYSPHFEQEYLILYLDTEKNIIMGNAQYLNLDLFFKIKKANFNQLINNNKEIMPKYIFFDKFKFEKKENGNYIKLEIINGNTNYNKMNDIKYEIS